MFQTSLIHRFRGVVRQAFAVAGIACVLAISPATSRAISLADKPLFSTVTVPGNLLLALSVEWPTASTPAYLSTVAYTTSTAYVGYFDAEKCYRYVYDSATPANSHFVPHSTTTTRNCSSTSTLALWSGNYLNWASTQTMDAFRATLTGGFRSVDTATETIIQKTRHSGQGGAGVYPDKALSTGTGSATPFGWSSVVSRIRGLGVEMYLHNNPLSCSFTTNASNKSTFNCNVAGTALSCNATGAAIVSCTATSATPAISLACTRDGATWAYSCGMAAPTPAQTCTATTGSRGATGTCSPAVVDYSGQSTAASNDTAPTYRVYVRVKACDAGVGLESNCVQYGSNYKPEGLMQQYSSKLRYSAFGYLNDDTDVRDGGVMRSRMKYIGPTKPVPGSTAITNPQSEWDASTGVMAGNPDSTDASTTSTALGLTPSDIPNSGAMNYLNKFGNTAGVSYKSKDPVGELYYAGLRYFKKLGNVPSYTDMSGATDAQKIKYADGFPVITEWDDPIQYSCQKNFILGIGDVNTHYDNNLPGTTITGGVAIEPAMPSEVSGDSTVDVSTATNMVGTLEGIAGLGSTRTGSSSHGSYYIAGLAYDAHTKDIRTEADMPDSQTVSTYWLDVMENQVYKSKNMYWLAAKYGGFTVPTGFTTYDSANGTSTLADSTWWTTGDLAPNDIDNRPDNYFLANQADKMRAGLTAAFAKIVSENDTAVGTAFAAPTARVKTTGSFSYSSNYAPKGWTGVVLGSSVDYDPVTGTPSFTQIWNAQSLLDSALLTSRKVVTCCTSAGAGLPFTSAALTSATLHSRTNYASFANVPGAASQSAPNFVAYLRGDRTKELGQAGGAYRLREHLLGDIVNSKVNPVGPPVMPYSDAKNPGYGAFRATHKDRPTVVYAGSNDGMLHAFDGASGSEKFAYIPSFVYGDSSTASATGLASLGNPGFTHHYFVDGSPQSFDVDMRRTQGSTPTSDTDHDWRTILIGGLGKGGKGYYALDVTDPASWTSEGAVAGKVLWEFTDSRMGYTYGEVSVVKTAKYGWVVIMPSGYNNSDGKGYFFIVNALTGALIEAVETPEGSTSAPLDMAYLSAFVNEFTDFTADSAYAGDLLGNVWRVDLTTAPATIKKIATLASPSGAGQPVTTRPLIELDPGSKKRYLLVGTGRLLDDSDVASTQTQSFYSILDGTQKEFFTDTTLPTGASFPISRTQLNLNSSLLTGIGTAPPNQMGWYIDLAADPTSGIAERINVTPTANVGVIGVALNRPNGQACTPQGSNRAFAVTFSDGKSVLLDSVDGFTPLTPGVATDIAFISVNNKTRLIVGDSTGSVVSLKGQFSSFGGVMQLNWREVPTVD